MKNRGKLISVIGGARSGKSSLAEHIAQSNPNSSRPHENDHNQIIYVATAYANDDEMKKRIEKHKQSRPQNWKTVEAQEDADDIIETLSNDDNTILVDCLTVFISNLLIKEIGEDGRGSKGEENNTGVEENKDLAESDVRDQSDIDGGKQTNKIEDKILERIEKMIVCARNSAADIIIVSNEVGMGVVPPYKLGRIFRDIAGKANQLLSKYSDEVYFMHAGVPCMLKGKNQVNQEIQENQEIQQIQRLQYSHRSQGSKGPQGSQGPLFPQQYDEFSYSTRTPHTHQPLECGLVQIYKGDGKGKTTAAMGLSLRAAGHGFRTCIIQFLKGTGYSGELYSIPSLKGLVEITQFGRGCANSNAIRDGIAKCQSCGDCFVPYEDIRPSDRALCDKAFEKAKSAVYSGDYDIVIMDEIAHGIKLGLVKEDKLLKLIRSKPKNLELVLTGREFPKSIKAAADLVTNMQMEKHPFDRGFESRRGIEY